MAKRVLVTQSSRGIGRAAALRLAKDGFEVALHCRKNLALAEAAAGEINAGGGKAAVLQFDVSNRDECAQVLTAEIEKNGCFYGVVCNAGVTADAVFPGLTGEAWDAVLNVNLGSFYNVLHPLVLPMISAHQGGRIVTLSSVAGLTGSYGQVNYSASKAGIIGATKALARELAKRQITVNCVAPGMTETDMVQNLPLTEVVQQIPLRRLGRPEDVAAAVSFFVQRMQDI